MPPHLFDRVAVHGIVTRTKLVAAGMPRTNVDTAIRLGRIVAIYPGVFRVAGAPETWESRIYAAVVSTGGIAAHRSAARLWGLLDTDVVEVALPPQRNARRQGLLIHRCTDVPGYPSSRRDGIPTMNPMQMLVHLGAVCDREVVEDVYDAARISRLCSARTIEVGYDRLSARGRDGSATLRAILDDNAIANGEPDSSLEPRMARLMRKAELPTPVFQHWVTGAIRVDFAYPALRLVIEVDGLESRSTRRGQQRMLDRQNALVELGWHVIRFTWADVVKRPKYVADVVRRHLDLVTSGHIRYLGTS